MAALAAAELTGTDRNAAIAAIENYIPSNNRSQMMKGKENLLIVDAYNANPTSMSAALENFRQMEAANKVVILGDMLELGADSQKEHAGILAVAKSINIRYYFFVGKEFRNAAAGDKFYETKGHFFDDSPRLREFLEENPLRGNTILIKGSRGTKLEKVLEILA
jgi:UDP-N-acetylmuramoyl-tripeptide--D-alanyl-D-alanine ligase